jgi:hypothetical protein
MTLQKRDCPLGIELIPCGSGWTHVYLTIGDERLFFVVSNVLGDQFSNLVEALYFFNPSQYDHDDIGRNIECKDGTFEVLVDDGNGPELISRDYADIPYRAKFYWDEEGSLINWVLEREPNLAEDFPIKVHIEISRAERKEYDFDLKYKDLCYAVAKACTKVLKEYGFWGYHYSTYHEDINIRQLLYIKAVALDYPAIRALSPHPSGYGEVSKLEDELYLLLFDM